MENGSESVKGLEGSILGKKTSKRKDVLAVNTVMEECAYLQSRGIIAKPGDDVVITKWIALEGTSIIAKEKEDELLKRFPDKYIYDAINFNKILCTDPEAAGALKSGVTAIHKASRGGIFKALWEIGEANGVGLTIELKKIPVKQETIEICNYFDINPYELLSGGALVMTSADGNRLVMDLKALGINAVVVGKVTNTNDRVLINGEHTRFLEPRKEDEIKKIIK